MSPRDRGGSGFEEEREEDSLRTRASLLSKVQDLRDDSGWREFFNKYWRLIYHFGRRAGLNDADAQDLVQEVLLAVSKAMPGFSYDRSKGRFRTWLLTLVRTRLANHWGRRSRVLRMEEAVAELNHREETTTELERHWDDEWNHRLLAGAMELVRQRTQGRHYLFFDMVERQGVAVGAAAAAAGFNVAHAYVIRHRLRGLLREEVKRMEND